MEIQRINKKLNPIKRLNITNPIQRVSNQYIMLNCFNVVPNLYEINNVGEVRNIHDRTHLHKSNSSGYHIVNVKTINGKRPLLIHRLVAGTFCVKKYGKDIVNHIDGNKRNNYYKNLEWCTVKENTNHAIKMGLHKVAGEDNATARFKNSQIHEICKLMAQNVQYSKILEMCGIEVNTQNLDILTKIRSKHIWKHISDQYDISKPENRTKQIKYTDEQIHKICKLICNKLSNIEIANEMNIDISDSNKMDKYLHFIQRIRKRKSYKHITQYYIW